MLLLRPKKTGMTRHSLFVTACGFTINADHNAAINIERAGHAQLACQANDAVMSSATGTT
jgi:putative transposase